MSHYRYCIDSLCTLLFVVADQYKNCATVPKCNKYNNFRYQKDDLIIPLLESPIDESTFQIHIQL